MGLARQQLGVWLLAYFRVSTDRQASLEAQRKSVLNYLNSGQWDLVAKFTEIESGKHNDRELAKALAACKKQKAVIAKLDRLSRNLAFIATCKTRRGEPAGRPSSSLSYEAAQ